MLIQAEPPECPDPLVTFDEDYEWAVVHLAWAEQSETGDNTLLFAWVELLPVEIPAPPAESPNEQAVGSGVIKTQHIVVPARRGLEWYLQVRAGTASVPSQDLPPADAVANETVPLRLTELGECPPWPALVSASSGNAIPFCPSWHETPRVHHLVPLARFPLEDLWIEESDRASAMGVLQDTFHFSLDDHPEYWGSIHLVAVNPVYRDLQSRLYERTAPQESILVRFEPRAGKSVSGLSLTYVDKLPWGATDHREIAVRRPFLRLDFDRRIETTKRTVFDPRRGVLEAWDHELAFLRSVSVSIEPIGESLRVDHGPDATYEVSRRESPPARAKPSRAASGRSRMLEAHYKREERGRRKHNDQLTFSSQRKLATEEIRSRVMRAEQDLLFVDPCFGLQEFFTFALAVSFSSVPVRVVTSAAAMGTPGPSPDSTIGAMLLAEIVRIRSRPRMNSFEVRVIDPELRNMDGCFLVVDERAWLLSRSFRDFGEAESVMVQLPEPEPVRNRLVATWQTAKQLDRWLTERAGGATHEG